MTGESREAAITKLLDHLAEGDAGAAERLAEAVVQRLEKIARAELGRRNPGRLDALTLEPRIFAHDALMAILESPRRFSDRQHFFAYATKVMVRAMIDYHRAKQTKKRGGEHLRVELPDDLQLVSAGLETAFPFEAVPAILDELEKLDPRKADVVRLRVFWGASLEEIARALGVSLSSVGRDWRFAQRWLAVRLAEAQDG